jgi:hypothetical protein
MLFPEDPEPEFVDINDDNLCVVTLQENNGIVLVDLTTGTVTASFTAGAVDLDQIDVVEEDIISQTGNLSAVPREPDTVVWISADMFATADEGDLDGGSRGFTIFSTDGSVVSTSGNEIEHLTARFGHYPEKRSENKGAEPEGLAYGVFGGLPHLFVLSERGSIVLVYDVSDPAAPAFVQALPTGTAPEGAKTIGSRNLLIIASEADDRDAKLRSSISIYQFSENTPPSYPTLVSVDRADGTPIPFSALSGLSAGGTYPDGLES